MSHFAQPLLQRIALAAAIVCGPLAAQAATVSLTAVEALGTASAGSAVDVMDGNASGGDFYRDNSDGLGNSSFFHTYGSPSALTSFGARTSGTGTWYTRTSATYSDSYTNTSGGAQLVTFSFNVDSAQVGLAGSGTGYADLALNLNFNGSTAASAAGRVEQSGGSPTCTSAGSGVLASYLGCSAADAPAIYASGDSYSVNYTLAAGDTLSVVYQILATTSGTAMDVSGAEVYCTGFLETFVVEDGQEPGQGGSCAWFNGIARSGDPAGFQPTADFSLTARNVPEPGSLLLVATAALGLLHSRRRRG